ncbi:hypothetical protein SEEK5349_09778 [Salmonella enterica subsp. enterica serovar Kentucky str. 5349]|nr:hypothetical protein SEEK5349_09778 [Salmonella enterica subsp. enterica serovar Kentucky str. 5349]
MQLFIFFNIFSGVIFSGVMILSVERLQLFEI